MSRGVGFSDGCVWRAPAPRTPDPIPEADVAAIRHQVEAEFDAQPEPFGADDVQGMMDQQARIQTRIDRMDAGEAPQYDYVSEADLGATVRATEPLFEQTPLAPWDADPKAVAEPAAGPPPTGGMPDFPDVKGVRGNADAVAPAAGTGAVELPESRPPQYWPENARGQQKAVSDAYSNRPDYKTVKRYIRTRDPEYVYHVNSGGVDTINEIIRNGAWGKIDEVPMPSGMNDIVYVFRRDSFPNRDITSNEPVLPIAAFHNADLRVGLRPNVPGIGKFRSMIDDAFKPSSTRTRKADLSKVNPDGRPQARVPGGALIPPERVPEHLQIDLRGRTPVELNPDARLGTTSRFGSGDESATSLARRQAEDELAGHERSVERQNYTARRLAEIRGMRPPDLTPSQRDLWDAPWEPWEREAIIDRMVQIETQGMERVNLQIYAQRMDPNGIDAMVMRETERGRIRLERENALARAQYDVRMQRIAPQPGQIPTGRGSKERVKKNTGLNEVSAERRAELEAQAAGAKARVYREDSPIPDIPPWKQSKKSQAIAKALKDAKKLPPGQKRRGQRGVDDEGNPLDAETFDDPAVRDAIVDEQNTRDLMSAEVQKGDQRVVTRMSEREIRDEATRRFEEKFGRKPDFRVKKEFGKPDERIFIGEDHDRMKKIVRQIKDEQPAPDAASANSGVSRGTEAAEPYVDSGGPLTVSDPATARLKKELRANGIANWVADNGRQPNAAQLRAIDRAVLTEINKRIKADRR